MVASVTVFSDQQASLQIATILLRFGVHTHLARMPEQWPSDSRLLLLVQTGRHTGRYLKNLPDNLEERVVHAEKRGFILPGFALKARSLTLINPARLDSNGCYSARDLPGLEDAIRGYLSIPAARRKRVRKGRHSGYFSSSVCAGMVHAG